MRLGDTACRTLAAVLTLHARNGRVTVRDVAGEVGMAVGWTHEVLERLRRAGLVTWAADHKATIRPTCAVPLVSHDERMYWTSATLAGENREWPGRAVNTPGLADTPGGADMAGPYPGTPTHAQGRR